MTDRAELYERMKGAVVIVESVTPGKGRQEEVANYGTGFILTRTGIILTCAHNILQGYNQINCRIQDSPTFVGAELIDCDRRRDMALIKLKNCEGVGSSVKFYGAGRGVEVGMEVFSIGHPGEFHLYYNYAIGQIARCDKCENCRQYSDKELKIYSPDLPMIQINNIHGTKGVSGSPVFNSVGEVLGMIAFISKHYDFAINLSALVAFIQRHIQKYNELADVCQ